MSGISVEGALLQGCKEGIQFPQMGAHPLLLPLHPGDDGGEVVLERERGKGDG
jgi:hypothetical protein